MKDFIDVSKSKFNEIEYDYRTNPMRLLIPNSTTMSSQKKQEIKRKIEKRKQPNRTSVIIKFTKVSLILVFYL